MSTDADHNAWFAEEVLPHTEALRSWLRARYPSLPDVDNVVQECLVRVSRARADAPVGSAKALLFTVARNLALDVMRRQQVVAFEPITEYDESSVYRDDTDVVATVNKQQELDLLAEAIQALPERCRQVFTLRAAYGLSQREIAVRLGISENTVEKQIGKGLRRCTEFFAARGLP
jgi:RNA polymerase sigma factor (sigma-70 family)